jgi:hypothetical protein
MMHEKKEEERRRRRRKRKSRSQFPVISSLNFGTLEVSKRA